MTTTPTRAVCEAATPGPWRVDVEKQRLDCDGNPRVMGIYGPETIVDYGMGPERCDPRIVETDGGYYEPRWHDARFIALARTALPEALDEIDRLQEHVRIMSSAVEAYRQEVERLKRAPSTSSSLTSSCIHCSLLETREKQATDMCSWLTAENQRLRDALEIAKHLDGEWDEVLEQGEEDAVENAQLRALLVEACDIGLRIQSTGWREDDECQARLSKIRALAETGSNDE